MVAVATYLKNFITGAGLGYPIVMKAGGLNVDDFKTQLTITSGTSTIFLGGLVMVKTGTLEADIPVAKDFTGLAVVLMTNHNKAILELAGVTVAKGAAFPDDDLVIDVLLLVPGMILSLRHDSVAALDIGDDVRMAADGDCAALAAIATDVDQRAKIGMALTLIVGTTGTKNYIAVMVK